MNDPPKQYWFSAKRYGWGWGPPMTWQGWLVMLVWIAVVTGVSPWLVLRSVSQFALFMATMVATIIAICYAKGEPPRWRWGGK